MTDYSKVSVERLDEEIHARSARIRELTDEAAQEGRTVQELQAERRRRLIRPPATPAPKTVTP